ncbi:hypothetical protein ACQP2F_15625 [Actinoplanes sp. CA-030573]|uniref:hypothetical protein n=1 Tax=Actinoplanes sp. CA-030573 TaxID=3239898 RepID=UPI003D8E113A
MVSFEVEPSALLSFGGPARGIAEEFGGDAAALEGTDVSGDIFGTIRSSAVVAAATRNAQQALTFSFNQAMQAAGFMSEAVPSAANSSVSRDEAIAVNIGGVAQVVEHLSPAAETPFGAGLLDPHVFGTPQPVHRTGP